MPGLLGQNTSRGLLGGSFSRMNVGATDEALRRHREQQEAARMAQQAAPQAQGGLLGGNAPAAPQRERVSGWRLFDRVLGGQTISEGLDAERARLSAEAMRPQQEARMQQLRGIAESMGPAGLAAFETNPEEFGKALSSRLEGRTLDQGDVYMEGRETVFGAPFDATPGSSVFNPLNPEAPLAVARSENKVAGGALVSPDGRVLYRGPQVEGVAATADAFYTPEIAQGQGGGAPAIVRQARPDTVTVSDGAEVYDPASGQIIARNAPDAPPVDPAAAQKAAGAANAALERIRNTRAKVDEALGATNNLTAGFLGGLTSRVGGTPAANLAATIDTIEANLSFSELQKMRDNSPTGGALGQVTERELALLGATVASLRQSQSPEQLRRNLGVINESLARWEAAVRQSQQAAPAASGGISREAAIAEARRRGLIP